MTDTGIIFDIQRFSVHDGPGIRTTVFLKGCPLRCAWCSNPESQSFKPQLIVRDIKCQACGACVKSCLQQAMTIEGGKRSINWELCDNCVACVPGCLYQSLNVAGRQVDMQAVVDEVMKDLAFYKRSGGGVTISGGEPLAQPEFALSLCRQLKGKGLHVTLDTSGHAPVEKLLALLPFLDLVLFDIKHMDSEAHRQYTSVPNDLILSNLSAIAGKVRVWLRIPLIAGFNDAEEHIDRVISLAGETGAEKISFLPYHEGGSSKCSQIGTAYSLPAAGAPDKEHLALLQGRVTDAGLQCGIGK